MVSRRAKSTSRGLNPWVPFLGLAAMVWAGDAAALPGCEGTYAATLLHPLPASIVVGLDIHDPSPDNRQLAERFLAGVRDSGVAVGAQPTVLLHLTVSVLGDTAGRSGGGAESSYDGMGGFQGGMLGSLPDMPTTRLAAPRASSPSRLLFVRVDATEGQATRISWVASMQCQRTTLDDGQLAHELGRVVGSALGQRIERRKL